MPVHRKGICERVTSCSIRGVKGVARKGNGSQRVSVKGRVAVSTGNVMKLELRGKSCCFFVDHLQVKIPGGF